MSSTVRTERLLPEIRIDVVERARRARKGHITLDLERDVEFSTEGLESYAKWEPVIYDAIVLAAAIEYGDKILKRPQSGWARRFSLRIPVHDPSRWNSPKVANALQDAIEFLTGDYWTFEFGPRSSPACPQQGYLYLPSNTKAVIPYSDGMDSRAVAGMLGKSLGDALVRVRIGSTIWDREQSTGKPELFAIVPYNVPSKRKNREPTGRSRGFKFSLITSIAAYFTDAKEIIIPESGQGVIGPALICVGHAYPDYRNHPFFTQKMANFVNALLETGIRFVFPRIWSTKGQTLREFVSACGGDDWKDTRSCWRGNNWASVNGKLRQCGVCAACMLRRLSVHAAGLIESPDAYVTINMNAPTLDEALDKSFTKRCRSFDEYALAGTLHMDHLAAMAEPDAARDVKRHAGRIGPALGLPYDAAETQLMDLLCTHSQEWHNYLRSLTENSFVKNW